MSELRALGHRPDKPDSRDFHISAHPKIGATTLPKSSVLSVRKYLRGTRDQGPIGSCVAHGICAMLEIDADRDGIPMPDLSRLGVYVNGRPLPLSDEGLSPRIAIDSVRRLGVVAETRWPYDVTRVNDDVPYDVFQHGADAKVEAYYSIPDEGQARLDWIDRALAAGYGVGWATQVDAPWDGYTSGVMGDYDGSPTRGGHYPLICGKESNGSYDVENWWSKAWGLSGAAFVSAARIASPISTDFWVVELAPRGVS